MYRPEIEYVPTEVVVLGEAEGIGEARQAVTGLGGQTFDSQSETEKTKV